MKIITSIDEIPPRLPNPVITIGNFDGVHLGHQALFRQVREKAAALEGTSIAMTFEPHPARVLRPGIQPPAITILEQKVELIGQAGMDILICIPFTREFAAISAGDFVEKILLSQIGVKAVVIGEDYCFGKNREGNSAFLERYGKAEGFEVIIVPGIPVAQLGMDRVSSTKIRELIAAGEVEKAPKLLGRHYQVRGSVVSGRRRGGKMLGFPTANLRLTDELCPEGGVYAVTVEWNRVLYPGVANIGYSPTFGDQQFTVEVHLLDFTGELYGQNIRVNFIARLRDETRFESVEALAAQIGRDIIKAREILGMTDSRQSPAAAQ